MAVVSEINESPKACSWIEVIPISLSFSPLQARVSVHIGVPACRCDALRAPGPDILETRAEI